MGVGRRGSATPQGLGEFAIKAAAFANVGVPAANRAAVNAAALLAKQAAEASIRAGSGGDMVLSNVGRSKETRGAGSRAKVGARYDIKGVKNPTALVYATGPLHILDNPTRPTTKTEGGRIIAKVSKGRKGSRQRGSFYNAIFGGSGGFAGATPLRTPWGPRYSVKHRGTAGKRTFFRGIDAAKPMLPRQFQSTYRTAMRRYWA
jgi:hypothetical protein